MAPRDLYPTPGSDALSALPQAAAALPPPSYRTPFGHGHQAQMSKGDQEAPWFMQPHATDRQCLSNPATHLYTANKEFSDK